MIVEKRIQDFVKLGFGMFVHFGGYSAIGQGEWIKSASHMSETEYEKATRQFNPTLFDADKLVSMAKNAGAKYITFTTRHHEGFSLYNSSKFNDYNTLSTCGRDLVDEFVKSCRKYDIIPFFYHTTIDWYNNNYKGQSEQDFSTYLKYLRDSVELLCTNYGKIGGFWFDGNWAKPHGDWEETALYSLIRKYQPQAMIINNTGLFHHGALGHIELDSVTFERGNPKPINQEGSPKFIASEMCQILASHWGYGKNDINYKSMKEIITNLCECRRFGANLLLNIGPKGDGSISKYDEAIFEAIGKWIDVYGEAIYNVTPSNISNGNDFVLHGQNFDYLFVTDLEVSADENVAIMKETAKIVKLEGLNNLKSIEWIDNNEKLDFVVDKAVTTITATNFFYGTDYIVRVARINKL